MLINQYVCVYPNGSTVTYRIPYELDVVLYPEFKDRQPRILDGYNVLVVYKGYKRMSAAMYNCKQVFNKLKQLFVGA